MALNPMLPVSMVMGQSVSAGRLDDPKGEYQIKCLQPGRTGPTATGGDISMEGLVCFFLNPWNLQAEKLDNKLPQDHCLLLSTGSFCPLGSRVLAMVIMKNPKRICCLVGRIPIAGKISTMVFDKTGTITKAPYSWCFVPRLLTCCRVEPCVAAKFVGKNTRQAWTSLVYMVSADSALEGRRGPL